MLLLCNRDNLEILGQVCLGGMLGMGEDQSFGTADDSPRRLADSVKILVNNAKERRSGWRQRRAQTAD